MTIQVGGSYTCEKCGRLANVADFHVCEDLNMKAQGGVSGPRSGLLKTEKLSEAALAAAREWYVSVDEVLVNNVFAKPSYRQALDDGINRLAATIDQHWARLRAAVQERLDAFDEYHTNPAVTSRRCGLADEELRTALQATGTASGLPKPVSTESSFQPSPDSASPPSPKFVSCGDLFEAWWESEGLDGEKVKARNIDRWTLAKMAFEAGQSAPPSPVSDSPKSEWRDIESAPKDGTWILSLMRTRRHTVVRWGGDGWVDDNSLYRDPVQWTPLPDPPATTQSVDEKQE